MSKTYHSKIYEIEVGDMLKFTESKANALITKIDREACMDYQVMWLASEDGQYLPSPGKLTTFALKELERYFLNNQVQVLKVIK